MVASVFIDEKGKKAVLAFHMHNFTSHNTLTVICASPGAFCLTFSEGHFQTPSKVRSDPVVWEHHLILNPSFEFVFSLFYTSGVLGKKENQMFSMCYLYAQLSTYFLYLVTTIYARIITLVEMTLMHGVIITL